MVQVDRALMSSYISSQIIIDNDGLSLTIFELFNLLIYVSAPVNSRYRIRNTGVSGSQLPSGALLEATSQFW